MRMDKKAIRVRAEEVNDETKYVDFWPDCEDIIDEALTQVWNDAIEAAANTLTRNYETMFAKEARAIHRLRIEE